MPKIDVKCTRTQCEVPEVIKLDNGYGAVPLLEEYRGGILENVNFGFIAIVNRQGELVAQAGNPEQIVFYRSASKPIQALPVLARGLAEEYGFSDPELAVMAASHRGEPFHIAAVEGALAKINCREEDLCMLPTYPAYPPSRLAAQQGGLPRKLYHNCSGKHTAMLALARHLGVDIQGYWQIEHPVQQLILQVMASFTDIPPGEIGLGIDGCGVPVFAVPLAAMALGAMRLASPSVIADEAYSRAAARLGEIISRHPLYIAGTDFICSLLNMDSNLVAKGGAQGVYTIGMRREGLGIAFKIQDGSERAWPLVINEIFSQLGYHNKILEERMLGVTSREITNNNDSPVGERRTVFRLNT